MGDPLIGASRSFYLIPSSRLSFSTLLLLEFMSLSQSAESSSKLTFTLALGRSPLLLSALPASLKKFIYISISSVENDEDEELPEEDEEPRPRDE